MSIITKEQVDRTAREAVNRRLSHLATTPREELEVTLAGKQYTLTPNEHGYAAVKQ